MMFGGFQSLFRKMDPYASFHPDAMHYAMNRDQPRKRRLWRWKKAVRKIARASRKKNYKILGKRG